jgi:signal transduction histidine kinase
MRRLLGILRSDDGEGALAPQPGLADLNRLVEQARLAGVVVDLVVEGEAGAVPPGVDVAAYRLVQEALTNAHAEAGLTRARVVVRHEPRTLVLEIAGDGIVPANGVSNTDALLGVLRERVSVYGGALEARPSAAGGHTISARIPLPALSSAGGRTEP